MSRTEATTDLETDSQITMSGELARKIIHLMSLAISIGYYFLSERTMLSILLPFTTVALIVDYGRYYIKWINRFFNWAFAPILREHERNSDRKLLSGGTFVLISACICIVIFPRIITITAFSILIISDTASALFGRRFGKNHFLDKSLEGTIAFILSAWVVVIIAPKIGSSWMEYLPGLVAAVVGGIIEAMSVRLRVDDNFSVPLSIGIIMWLGYLLLSLLYPSVFGSVYQELVR